VRKADHVFDPLSPDFDCLQLPSIKGLGRK
jgi:hypothetical protein